MSDSKEPKQLATQLLPKVQELIDAARGRAAVAVNAELTMLYWQIGKLLREHVLAGERAEYGKQVVKQLAADLTARYGKGWSYQHLRHCLRVAETIPDEEILYTLCRELSWSHLRKLMYMDDPLKRDFYVEMILCTGKNEEHVELVQSHGANIRVAEYLTELPSREVLRQKLHESMKRARQKLLAEPENRDE